MALPSWVEEREVVTQIETVYDELLGIKFTLAVMDRALSAKISTASTKRTFNPKMRKYEDAIDSDLWAKNVIKYTVVGWQGVTRKVMDSLIEPTFKDRPIITGNLANELIEFDEDALNYLAEHCTRAFWLFVNESSLRVDEYLAEQKETEKKTL